MTTTTEDTMNNAETIARATGASSATYTVEHRTPEGDLVTDSTETYGADFHPAVTNLPDDHPEISHGAFHDEPTTVQVGPTFGSQVDEATHCASVSFGWASITWSDPDALADVGRILLSAAAALRERQAGA
jgi:hypothetical protein